MANEEVFTFCQDNFLSSSFAAFEDMRRRGHLCDLTIKVQNLSFSAHRVILTAGIPWLDSVFSGLEMENKELTIAENLDPKALELLIDFAYTGKVTISSENVQSLLAAAQFLQLSQVQNACLAFLSKELRPENIGKISTLACALNNTEVIQSSNAYIRKNFEEFPKREEFLNLPFECIKDIISSDELDVPSEEAVFEALIRWAKTSTPMRQGMLSELLKEIRLTYLSFEYLMETVESEKLIMSLKDCEDLVKKVRYYHLIPKRVPALSNLKTYPRNYLKKELYAVCVCSNCGFSGHRYDSNKDEWHGFNLTKKTINTTSSCWNNIVAVDGKIYRFLSGSLIQTFDIKNLKWDFLRIVYNINEGTTFASFENTIYCFCLFCDTTKQMLSFDTQQNKIIKTKSITKTWNYAGATTLGNSIYLTGGIVSKRCRENGRWVSVPAGSSNVAKYIPSSDEWSDVEPMLIARSRHRCTSLNGKIYVCGNSNSEAATMEVYDLFTDQWNLVHSFADSKVTYISLISDHDKIYAFTENEGEIYDPRTREWKSLKVPFGLTGVVSLPITTFK